MVIYHGGWFLSGIVQWSTKIQKHPTFNSSKFFCLKQPGLVSRGINLRNQPKQCTYKWPSKLSLASRPQKIWANLNDQLSVFYIWRCIFWINLTTPNKLWKLKQRISVIKRLFLNSFSTTSINVCPGKTCRVTVPRSQKMAKDVRILIRSNKAKIRTMVFNSPKIRPFFLGMLFKIGIFPKDPGENIGIPTLLLKSI